MSNITNHYTSMMRTGYPTQAQPDVADSKPISEAKVEEPEKKTLLEEVRDKGLGTYVDELKEKKKEELRQKILTEMGLSEEALANMSPEQRAQIEKMVNEEVRKRMTAEAELNKNEQDPYGLVNNVSTVSNQPVQAKIDGAGVGLGPLLALQEIEQFAQGEPDKKEETAG